jgi:signal transduction histidine kinase
MSIAVGELLSMLFHDLRNPLSSISMNAAHLSRNWPVSPDDPRPRARRQLEIILQEADRANLLLLDVMDAFDLASGAVALELGAHPVAALFDDGQARLCRPKVIDERRPSLAFERHLLGGPEVRCDRARIGCALHHLIEQAAKLADADRALVLATEPEGGGLRLSVGQRLTDERQAPTEAQIFGRGIGMYAARSLIDAHGGPLRAERSDGGWRLCFALPLAG